MPDSAASAKLRSPRENHNSPTRAAVGWNCLASLADGPECWAQNMSILASLTNLFSGGDLLIILLVILLLFGAKKLPELARGMGQAIKEFQKAKDEFSDELHKAGDTTKPVPPASTVARTDAAATSAVRPDPNQAVTPGDKADQV